MNISSVIAVAADTAAPAAAQGAKGAQDSGLMGMLPMIAIMMVLFYILIILPQKKGQKQVEDMRNSIKSGDKVKSIGGIYGTVTAVDTTNNTISVQVDKNTNLVFDRNAIATVTKKEGKGVEK